ncbi:SWI/SNF complex subunit SWI3A [Melia azedarach]|uniref:SWI/SNF complex subunit SWI3A n=1 Tax=Melia azedarach TaxID=155640 RepID=A0ACC1YYP9_MELAZ|nr:SWI/SNF complex subunit SWI3A [Melia azedarach]
MEMSQYDPISKPEFELYTIPSHSSWFRWDDIHERERIALKEFFDGSSISRTPKIYKEYRDFIINKYREEPSRRLTFTQVRKSLVGDVSLLQKVFDFLDQWGLINFSATSGDNNRDSLEDKKLKDQAKIEEGAPNGVRVVATPNSLRSISVPNGGWDGTGKAGAAASETGFKLPPLASYSDVFGDLVKLKGLKCGNCGEQFSSGCYENSKQGNFVICEKCFKNGNYGENKSMDDFTFNDRLGNSCTRGATWTEAETLLLLESVMKHGDNWELVAQHVPRKTKLDCISKLIELPFGEFMTGSAHERNGSSCPPESTDSVKQGPVALSENQEVIKVEDQVQEQMNETEENGDAASEKPPAKKQRTSLLPNAGSSLINQVALISTMAGPHVTAAAAEAAVTALCDESSFPREIFDGDEDYLANGLSMLSESERAHQADASENKENQSESQDGLPNKNEIPLTLRIRAATATALGAAAAKAKLLASQEDREIEHLVATILETQLKKLQSKVKYFEDLEMIMEEEYTEMMELKECLVEERIDVLQRALNAGVSKWRDYTKSLFGSVL